MVTHAPSERVKDLMENQKNWVEHCSTPELMRLLKLNRDICEEKIKVLDSQGFIVERTAFPKMFLNKYFLYRFLRKNDRCPKCSHAEKVLKKSTTKKGK
jgi:hypothetical protein